MAAGHSGHGLRGDFPGKRGSRQRGKSARETVGRLHIIIRRWRAILSGPGRKNRKREKRRPEAGGPGAGSLRLAVCAFLPDGRIRFVSSRHVESELKAKYARRPHTLFRHAELRRARIAEGLVSGWSGLTGKAICRNGYGRRLRF